MTGRYITYLMANKSVNPASTEDVSSVQELEPLEKKCVFCDGHAYLTKVLLTSSAVIYDKDAVHRGKPFVYICDRIDYIVYSCSYR